MTESPQPYTDETIKSFVAGTLDVDTATALLKRAETDAVLAAELALWRGVRQVGREEARQRQPDALGWSRIARQIAGQAPQHRRAANDSAMPVARPFWNRPLIAPWQAAAALVVAVAGWQTVMAPILTPADPATGSEYALAGEEPSTAFVLRVAFAETANAGELRALLQAVDARVIDGPSAVGLYDLAFADAAALAAARERLTQEPELIDQISAN